jgi:hypothetical protein
MIKTNDELNKIFNDICIVNYDWVFPGLEGFTEVKGYGSIESFQAGIDLSKSALEKNVPIYHVTSEGGGINGWFVGEFETIKIGLLKILQNINEEMKVSEEEDLKRNKIYHEEELKKINEALAAYKTL